MSRYRYQIFDTGDTEVGSESIDISEKYISMLSILHVQCGDARR